MRSKRAGLLRILYHLLLILGLALVLFLVGGTLYGLFFRNAPPRYTLPANPVSPLPQGQYAPARDGIFTGIGRLRVITADKPPVTVIVSIAFPYAPEDRPFTEELASKVPDFRHIVLEYFGTHTAQELRDIDEGTLKAELLRRYNLLLHLGAIEILYFNDLMFIE